MKLEFGPTNLGAWDIGCVGDSPMERPMVERNPPNPPPLTEAEKNRGPMTEEEFRRLMPLCWWVANEGKTL